MSFHVISEVTPEKVSKNDYLIKLKLKFIEFLVCEKILIINSKVFNFLLFYYQKNFNNCVFSPVDNYLRLAKDKHGYDMEQVNILYKLQAFSVSFCFIFCANQIKSKLYKCNYFFTFRHLGYYIGTNMTLRRLQKILRISRPCQVTTSKT